MEKSTKLIIAAIGLGGLGYFLYKKGLFAKTTTTEVAKDVKKVDDVVKKVEDIVKEVVDTGKKTAVEPTTKPCEVIYSNCTPNPLIKIIQIPYDDEKCDRLIRYGGYQPDPPPCAPRGNEDDSFIKLYEPIDFRDNTYYDQPIRTDPYMGRDMINDRFNQYIYA
jgi:hypothetical protein